MFTKIFKVLTMVFMMLALIIPASPTFAAPIGMGIIILAPTIPTVTVTNSPSNEDKDWTITSVKTGTSIDPSSGKVINWTVTIRVNPHSVAPDPSLCPENSGSPATTYCNFVNQTTASYQGSLGTVTLFIKNYANHYCSDSQCPAGTNYYSGYKLEVYWTRSSSYYTVQNADTTWGCATCQICNGGTYTTVYDYGTFNPGWNNATTSKVYTYTRTFPIIKAADITVGGLTGHNSGSIYYNGAYIGTLAGSATYGF